MRVTITFSPIEIVINYYEIDLNVTYTSVSGPDAGIGHSNITYFYC